jgi:SAM-dependent methyltransferase
MAEDTVKTDDIGGVIPTSRGLQEVQEKLSEHSPWFYEFRFSNGAITDTSDALALVIHRTRAQLIFPFLDAMFEGRWSEVRCLDMACHEGWFASQVAMRGARGVVGIDIREEHITKARLIKELGNFGDLTFTPDNVMTVDPEKYGTFEITLMLGLLYHLDDPLGALRAARAVTQQLFVVESQVARGSLQLECLWGSDTMSRQGPALALVQSDPAHVEPGKPVVLVPTLNALQEMLYAVGFSRVYLAIPPRPMYEQYPNYDRVVVFAQVL